MTHTTNPAPAEPTDLHDMVVVHRVFRRELLALADLVLATRPGDLDRAGVVVGHARLVLSGLHLHHTSEDDLLWPLLLERCAPSTGLVGRMEAQHAAVDDLLERLATVLDRWEAEARPAVAEEAAEGLRRLHACVVEHLDEEEREIMPLAADVITPEEWAAVGEAGVAKMTRAEVPLMFGAVLEDASPAEQRQMLAALPVPVRVLVRVWGRGHYRRYITRVRTPR